jgi:hypothetical protein
VKFPWQKPKFDPIVLEAQLRAEEANRRQAYKIEHMRERAQRIGDRYLLRDKEVDHLLTLMLAREHHPQTALVSDWLEYAIKEVAPGRWEHVKAREKIKQDIWDAAHKVIMDAADADLCAAGNEPFVPHVISIPGRIFQKDAEIDQYETEPLIEVKWLTGDYEIKGNRMYDRMKGVGVKDGTNPREGERCRIYARTLDNTVYRRKADGVVVRVAERHGGPMKPYTECTVRFGDKNLSVHRESKFMSRDVNGHLRLYIPLSVRDAERFQQHMGMRRIKEYCMADVELSRVAWEQVSEQEDDDMMSRDRVEFQIGGYSGGERAQQATTRAAIEALGIEQYQIASAFGQTPLTVRCRPSQFARFLILRNEYGGTNDFKGLKAKLVPAVETPPIIDVASNRNTVQP